MGTTPVLRGSATTPCLLVCVTLTVYYFHHPISLYKIITPEICRDCGVPQFWYFLPPLIIEHWLAPHYFRSCYPVPDNWISTNTPVSWILLPLFLLISLTCHPGYLLSSLTPIIMIYWYWSTLLLLHRSLTSKNWNHGSDSYMKRYLSAHVYDCFNEITDRGVNSKFTPVIVSICWPKQAAVQLQKHWQFSPKEWCCSSLP